MSTTIAKPAPLKPADAIDTTPGAAPLDADWPEQEAAAKGDRDRGASDNRPSAERREPGHIDSALESLGEAITDPVREAAEKIAPETTGQTSPSPTPKR